MNLLVRLFFETSFFLGAGTKNSRIPGLLRIIFEFYTGDLVSQLFMVIIISYLVFSLLVCDCDFLSSLLVSSKLFSIWYSFIFDIFIQIVLLLFRIKLLFIWISINVLWWLVGIRMLLSIFQIVVPNVFQKYLSLSLALLPLRLLLYNWHFSLLWSPLGYLWFRLVTKWVSCWFMLWCVFFLFRIF